MEKTIKRDSIWARISFFFAMLRPLVLMQLKDKLDTSYLRNKKKTFFKIVYSILIFIGITAGIFLLFKVVIVLGLFSFLQILNFRVYLILMTIIFVLSFLSCLVNVTKTLYFAKDNQVLLTMPVGNGTIFTSKLIVCYLYELIKNITYILPFFFAYGLIMNISLIFYLWAILSLIFVTLFMVSICGLLSIPAMWFTIILKKHKFLEFIILTAVIALVVYGVIIVISLIPSDIDIVRDWGRLYWVIQDFLESFALSVVPLDNALQLLTGMSYGAFVFTPFSLNNLITFGCILGIILASLLLVVLLSKPLFLKMASNPFEYKKKDRVKRKRNIKFSPFSSASFKNAKIIFRTSNILYSVLAVSIITPIAILLQNKIIGAMDTRMLGNYMMVAFNVLIIMLMTLSSNVIIASIYSKEGNSAYLNKINPVPYRVPLSGKFILNSLICSASIIASCVLINMFANIGTISTILLIVSLILLYYAHLFWSAELDIMNPQNRLYQTTGESQKNPNETKSTIIAFAMSIVVALVCLFLMSENISAVFIKLLFLSLAVFIIRQYLFLTRIKLYYKEK